MSLWPRYWKPVLRQLHSLIPPESPQARKGPAQGDIRHHQHRPGGHSLTIRAGRDHVKRSVMRLAIHLRLAPLPTNPLTNPSLGPLAGDHTYCNHLPSGITKLPSKHTWLTPYFQKVGLSARVGENSSELSATVSLVRRRERSDSCSQSCLLIPVTTGSRNHGA